MALAVLGIVGLTLLWPRRQHYYPPNDPVAIPSDAGSIARGKHLVEALAVCTICHGDDLGGKLAFDDPFLGHGYTANLTRGRGGVGRNYATADWIRAIRYGVRPDGSAIAFMPSDHYNAIVDNDLGAMVTYLQQLSPVANERTSVELNTHARFLINVGLFGQVNRTALIDFSATRRLVWDDAGEYLIAVGGCTFCHGPALRGAQGPEPGAPAAPDLTALDGLEPRRYENFARALRYGVAADGHMINPKYMPWLGYRNMTDQELAAIWRIADHRSFSKHID